MRSGPGTAGVVGYDDGVLQQSLVADRAPQCTFASDREGIGSDGSRAQAERLQMPLPVLGALENAVLMADELVDDDLRQPRSFMKSSAASLIT